jgi:hypothetical protein
MTMHGTTTETKDDTKTTKDTKTPSRGESAVRHLYKRALEEDRKEDADLIATIAKLLMPAIKLTAGLPFEPKKSKVDSAEVDGQAVDISEMADDDAEAYAEYAAELDGSAARERHVRRLEAEDREMAEIGRMHDGG